MGYYSDHKITLTMDDTKIFAADVIMSELQEISGYFLDDYGSGAYETVSVKWYGFNRDMHTISLRHPEVTFTVERYGEEHGDEEKWSIKNGQVFNEQKRGWIDA